MSVTSKTCRKCGMTKPAQAFYAKASNPDGLASWCKACKSDSRKARAQRVPSASQPATIVTDSGYVASRELLQLWGALQQTRSLPANGGHAFNLMFLGPSGSGKTEGARYLAEVIGVPFTKVDAAAMTDPEAWFGTREVVAKDGVSVTTYRPSEFVRAIQRPGVLLVDEVNRVRDEHRNILLPLFDGTHQITNPLTGDTVVKHPECYVIMSGNRGLQFTGTYAVDPALMTRAIVVEFDYLKAEDETRVVVSKTGASEAVASLFVRFANETRSRVAQDPDMIPVSTREVIAAAGLVACGLTVDLAAQVAIMSGASDEGGTSSVRHRLATIWAGIRPTHTA